nr:ribonuclease H-like domain-containing protein [Tanacetum cinerariifolium]
MATKGAKKKWGLSPKAKVRVLHTAQLDVTDINDHATTLISKLDLSNPLHLHPNDFAALPIVSVKLKGTENYQVWSCTMLLALEELILSRETLSDVKSAYAIISSEESHRIASGSLSETSQRPVDNGNRKTDGGSTLVCENCGFNDHTIDKYFKIIGYPVDFGKKKVGSNFKGKNVSDNVIGSSSSNGFSDEQMSTLISLIKENYINGKGVHSNMTGTYMNSSTMFDKNFEKFCCSNSSMRSKLVTKGLIRLGHPADQVLDVLKPTLKFNNKNTELICDTCQRAKHTREPFPLSDYVSTELGELVHLDLWGPYKVTSREGFRFFLTIVGDFSRAIWVYLLKSKIEVFHNTMVFIISLKLSFRITLRSLGVAMVLNLLINNFMVFCESNGRDSGFTKKILT